VFSVTFRAGRAIPLIVLALLVSGWLVIYRSEQLTEGSGRLVRQQVVWSIFGLLAYAAASNINYRRHIRASFLAYALVLLALVAVYFFPAVNGAQRWIRIAGVGVQPSEFAKVAFIAALSAFLMHRDIASGFSTGVLWPLLMALAPMVLILKEPDLGTALIFLPVLFAMLFGAGARRRDLVRLAAAGTLLLPLLWGQMSREQRSRVTALAQQNAPHEKPTADGFHLDQAKRMFALGNVWGSFFSPDARDELPTVRVPEPHTDSVYCVIGERFGLVGAGMILILYALLVGGCLNVAHSANEPYGRMIAVGVATLFAAEVLINTGMMVGLLPITGVSLPLVSYGGSDLIAHLLALGLVMSVSQHQPGLVTS
jgi:cell division protein FtsW (lipid II flippase)